MADLDVAPAPTDLTSPRSLLIDGRWRPAASGETRISIDPGTGESLAAFAQAGADDVDDAVQAAARAFTDSQWRDMTADARGRLLWRIAELIDADADSLARLESRDMGQPITLSTEVNLPLAAAVFRYYAGWCTKLEGRQSVVSIPDQFHYTRREPLGVCALITPWNFPLAIAAWKLAPALATGNTVVLKPAEQAPLSTLALAELCVRAGVPAGVVNCLTGGPEVGQALVAHPVVAKVSFTGSTEVGKEVAAAAAATLKRVSLELGGKAPSIIARDADIDAVVMGNVQGAMFNTGQACAAYTRFYVDTRRVDEFVTKAAKAASQLAVGPALDPETEIGPLISAEQRERVARYVDSGLRQGAQLITGGRPASGPLLDAGFFYEPTVFAGVRDDMVIARDEIFGPVMSILTYDDEDELLQRANDSDFGLAAVVWTQDLVTAHTFAHRIRAGTVFVNQLPLIDPGAPWGGFGMSGYGREMGTYALDEFTEIKGVFVNLQR
ncbi:MAG: aldehyde dehydrogenase family protein [Mycobacterium sp.]|uniref:aldehyde dehydrogenase family protein n=1 Tax=Mycobacterium sp. TaxID=1785 RepID=UPI001EB19CD1|nr:aldehyde dehydrogenase family protein [Mycobacterium sp.]MBW0019798.1 aldehyde dehydrogenase family protein [Mycobacterium sp.]